MKVLLAGGTGFIGSAVARRLKENGYQVRMLVRRDSVHKVDPNAGFEVVTGDILDTHACLRAMNGITAAVNLVGVVHNVEEVGTTFDALHTSGTFNLVNAGKIQGLKRFVQMSALGAAPDAPTRFQQTKHEADDIVIKSGFRYTIFRPAWVFGKGDHMHETLAEYVHAGICPVVDGYRGKFNPVSRDDFAFAVADCLHMPETQGKTYDIAGPSEVAWTDLIDRVARHYEVWPNNLKVPSALVRPTVKMLARWRHFPLSADQLLMMTHNMLGNGDEFARVFGATLGEYPEDPSPFLPTQVQAIAS